MADTNKNCSSCVNCEKYTRGNGESWWVCENYVKSVGMPVTVTPPGDAACENWSDDPTDKDKPQDALRHFVDHYWDEEATND